MRTLFSLLLGILTVFVWAQAVPDVRSMRNAVFPVAQVRPGMKGYGLTVFRGTKIERFEIEVIGVLEQAVSGKPLVMVRAKGGPITERNAMIIAGMSGSPVFIEGKILGAIGYGFSFSREPIGLVTPLEAMLTAFDPRFEAWHPTEPRTVMCPVRIDGRRYAGVYIGLERPPSPNLAWARPLMTPVMVRGVSPNRMKRLKEALERYGMTPVLAPGGTVQRALPVRFEPGAALGGALATGDIDLTAIGTLTYRYGDYVLGFGHPFLGAGAVEIPMTAAEIVDVVPGYADSFKVGNRAQVLGTIYRDEAFAIAGKLRQMPHLMPVRVQVSDPSKGVSRTFRCEVVRHPLITGILVSIAVEEFVGRVHFGMGNTSARVRWRLQTDRFGTLQYEDRVATNSTLSSEILKDLMYLTDLLLNARDVKVRLESLEMEVVITPTRATAYVASLTTDKPAYRPGEQVHATVLLRPYGGEQVSHSFRFRVPADASPGRYVLRVGSANQGSLGGSPLGKLILSTLDGEGLGMGGGSQSTETALREFLRRGRRSQLVASLSLQRPTVAVGGVLLAQPSPALRALFMTPRSSQMQSQQDELKQVYDTEWVLEGTQTVFLTVLPAEGGDGTRTTPFFFEGAVPSEDGATEFMPNEGEPSREFDSSEVALTSSYIGTDGADSSGGGESPREEVSPVSRKVQYWVVTESRTLQRGTLQGVAVDASGTLSHAPSLMPSETLPVDYLWSAVSDSKGVLYVGEGVSGGLWRIAGDRRHRLTLPATLITALAVDSEGNLYAGASPEGTLFRVQGDEVMPLGETGARYVNALVWQSGKLYIATGVPARVMVWESGQLRTLLTCEEAHFSALTVSPDGIVYAGTSEQGVIYRVEPTGVAEAIADLREATVSALFAHSSGDLFVGTMPSGNLYRVRPNRTLQPLAEQSRWSVRLWLPYGEMLFALASEGVLRVDPSQPSARAELVTRLRHDWVGYGLLADKLVLVSANGQLLTLESAEEGTYLSPVLDAQTIARWGTIRWSASLPEGAEVQIQTRSGPTREPDASWSGWSGIYGEPTGSAVFSPPARFLQVRVILRRNARLNSLVVSYLPANRPPEVHLQSLKPYTVVSDKYTLRWSARDPDGDSLRFEVQLSSDGGQSWTPLKSAENQPSEQASPHDALRNKSNAELQQELLAELDASPDIPQAVKAQIRAQAPEMVEQMRKAGETMPVESAQSATPSRENRLVWDTTQQIDGVYLLRLMASDQPAMPNDYATVYTTPVPVVVCNTPPDVLVSERAVRFDSEGRAELVGYAFQRATAKNGSERAHLLPGVAITAVQYRVDDGEWLSAEPLDGLFDSSYEPFRIRTEPLSKGVHRVVIRVYNAGGKSVQIEQQIQRET